MNPDPQPEPPIAGSGSKPVFVRTFGIGGAGMKVVEQLLRTAAAPMSFVALDTDAQALAGSSAPEKVHLEAKRMRGLGTGGDPDRGGALAEEHYAKLKSLCDGVEVVFIVAGLAGGAGTGISPILGRAARESGALVLAFVTMPFDCEGSRRQGIAWDGLAELKAAVDGVICLPNQKIFSFIDENTSVLDTFQRTAELLAEAVAGIWRLLAQPGLIDIRFDDLCELVRDRHGESVFAVAEAIGATRSREVVDKLLAHPMLDGGKALHDSEAVLISLTGGSDLTMAEVNRVMNHVREQCEHAQVIMGATIDPAFVDRLAITLVAARKNIDSSELPARVPAEPLDAQLLTRTATHRPNSRFVPPPPAIAPEQMKQLIARQGQAALRQRKSASKLQQTQLPLEIVSKGRFDKSEPTIHKGEDLDVPTYIRRGVLLN